MGPIMMMQNQQHQLAAGGPLRGGMGGACDGLLCSLVRDGLLDPLGAGAELLCLRMLVRGPSSPLP